MLLEDRVAVVYGGGGAIGGAVAQAFAREGARLFLAGRTVDKLDRVAETIRERGGEAETAIVDALNEEDVARYVDGVVERAGRIDISFNVIGYDDVQRPLRDLSVDEFLQPLMNATRSHFITATAAARHMAERGTGVILVFGGGGPQTMPGLGGFKVALDAVESLRRQLACDFGESGIRVVTLKTGGIPETIPEDFAPRDEIAASIERQTLLKRAATLEDVGNVAAFVASDRARTITGTEVNISSGSIID